MRRIPGRVTLEALALLNRPTDEVSLRAEAEHLAARGLRPRDIAAALGLTEQVTAALLESRPIASREVHP